MKTIRHLSLLAFLSIIFSILLALSSCNKVSHNGKLDGLCQILSIEDVATGDVSTPEPLEYIAFDLHIMQLQCEGPLFTSEMAYDKEAGTIHARFPYIKDEEMAATIGRFGIMTNPVDITITRLTHSSLVMRTPQTIITCRKY